MVVVIVMAGCVTAKWPRLDPGVVVVIAMASCVAAEWPRLDPDTIFPPDVPQERLRGN